MMIIYTSLVCRWSSCRRIRNHACQELLFQFLLVHDYILDAKGGIPFATGTCIVYNSWSWNLVSSVSVTRISTVLSKAMNVQHAGSVVTFSAAID
jgi:hypothetical protein